MKNAIINIFLIILLLGAGWTLHSIYEDFFTKADGSPAITGQAIIQEKNIPSPSDKITQDKIKVYEDRVVLEIENAEWSQFTESNSMDPTIGPDSNAIEIIPKTEEQVKEGDIVAYRSRLINGSILHRVIDKGEDDKGTYFILKGDNNNEADIEKVRFEQIETVVIAIIY